MGNPPPDPLLVFHESMDSVFCLLFHLTESNELVYAGTGDGNVHIWDLKYNRKLKTNKIGNNSCLALHHTESGHFVTQEKTGPITLWNEEKDSRHWHKHKVFLSSYVGFCRSILTHDNTLIVPDGDSVLKILSLNENTNEVERTMRCKNNEKTGEIMALKSFENFLLVLYESGDLRLWCVDRGECSSSLKLFDTNEEGACHCPMAFDFHVASSRGIIGSSSAELIEFSVIISSNGDHQLMKTRSVVMTNPGVSCVSIRSDAKVFVVGCWDGRIRMYSFKTLKLLVVLDNHRRKNVQDLVFAPQYVSCWSCDNLFSSGGLDGRLCLWSVY